MTNKTIDSKIMTLRALEAEQKRLAEEAEAIKTELKAELETLEVEELATDHYTIRWKEIISNKLDSKALKAAMPTVYEKFCKTSTSKRFTIA
jgi:predicted phage-related endonuclease